MNVWDFFKHLLLRWHLDRSPNSVRFFGGPAASLDAGRYAPAYDIISVNLRSRGRRELTPINLVCHPDAGGTAMLSSCRRLAAVPPRKAVVARATQPGHVVDAAAECNSRNF